MGRQALGKGIMLETCGGISKQNGVWSPLEPSGQVILSYVLDQENPKEELSLMTRLSKRLTREVASAFSLFIVIY